MSGQRRDVRMRLKPHRSRPDQTCDWIDLRRANSFVRAVLNSSQSLGLFLIAPLTAPIDLVVNAKTRPRGESPMKLSNCGSAMSHSADLYSAEPTPRLSSAKPRRAQSSTS